MNLDDLRLKIANIHERCISKSTTRVEPDIIYIDSDEQDVEKQVSDFEVRYSSFRPENPNKFPGNTLKLNLSSLGVKDL